VSTGKCRIVRRAEHRVIHNHDHPDDYELQVIQSLCYARSFESETVWVMVNAGGPAVEGFAGGSGVWAPLRGKIGGLDGEEGFMFVDVNTDLLKVCGPHDLIQSQPLTTRTPGSCTRSGRTLICGTPRRGQLMHLYRMRVGTSVQQGAISRPEITVGIAYRPMRSSGRRGECLCAHSISYSRQLSTLLTLIHPVQHPFQATPFSLDLALIEGKSRDPQISYECARVTTGYIGTRVVSQ
jgi:hypothetical protein